MVVGVGEAWGGDVPIRMREGEGLEIRCLI